MTEYYRKISVDNMNADLFAPAGILVRGAIGWEKEDTYASVVFDNIRAEAVLSVGNKDILPKVITIKTIPDGEMEGSVEYVFGAQKEVVLQVVRFKEESTLSLSFTDEKEEKAYLLIRLSKRCATLTMRGNPLTVLDKITKQTKEAYDHDTERTGEYAVATVSC